MDVVYAVFAGAKKRRLVRTCSDTLSVKIRDATLVYTNYAASALYLLFLSMNYFRSPY